MDSTTRRKGKACSLIFLLLADRVTAIRFDTDSLDEVSVHKHLQTDQAMSRNQAGVAAPMGRQALPKREPRVVEPLRMDGLADRVQAQLAKARTEGPTRPLRPELADAAKRIRQQVYEATLAALTAPAAPVPAATTAAKGPEAGPASLQQEAQSQAFEEEPLANLGSYAGCHNSKLPPLSCIPDAPAYYFGCARSLTGTIFEKSRKCGRDCSGLDGYEAFSVYDETICVCLKELPAPDDERPADLCEQAKSHVIYSQQALPGDGPPGSQERTTKHMQQHQRARDQEMRVSIQSLTCSDVINNVVQVAQDARSVLAEQCGSSTCQSASSSWRTEQLIEVTDRMTRLSQEADRKLCLIDVMTNVNVKLGVQDVLIYVNRVLQSGGSQEVNDRLEKAYKRMLAWQFGTMDLAKRMADRKKLIPTNIESRDVCPKECDSCSRSHFSLWRGTEKFKFKCYIKGADKPIPPERPGMTCEAKKLRNTFWLRSTWDHYKTWCQVDHWRERECQRIHVLGVTMCGTETIESALMTDEKEYATNPDERLPLLHQHCMDAAQGVNAISDGDRQKYATHMEKTDEKVPQWIKQLFNLVLAFGIANGLGAMRMAAVGNGMKNYEGGATDVTTAASAADVPQSIIDPFVQGRSVAATDRELYDKAHLGDCKILVVDEPSCKEQGFRRMGWVLVESVRWLAFTMLGSGIGMLLSVPITSAGQISKTIMSRMYLPWVGDSLNELILGGSFSVVKMFTMMLAGAGVPTSIDNPIKPECTRLSIPGILLQLEQNATNGQFKSLLGYDRLMIPHLKPLLLK